MDRRLIHVNEDAPRNKPSTKNAADDGEEYARGVGSLTAEGIEVGIVENRSAGVCNDARRAEVVCDIVVHGAAGESQRGDTRTIQKNVFVGEISAGVRFRERIGD